MACQPGVPERALVLLVVVPHPVGDEHERARAGPARRRVQPSAQRAAVSAVDGAVRRRRARQVDRAVVDVALSDPTRSGGTRVGPRWESPARALLPGENDIARDRPRHRADRHPRDGLGGVSRTDDPPTGRAPSPSPQVSRRPRRPRCRRTSTDRARAVRRVPPPWPPAAAHCGRSSRRRHAARR